MPSLAFSDLSTYGSERQVRLEYPWQPPAEGPYVLSASAISKAGGATGGASQVNFCVVTCEEQETTPTPELDSPPTSTATQKPQPQEEDAPITAPPPEEEDIPITEAPPPRRQLPLPVRASVQAAWFLKAASSMARPQSAMPLVFPGLNLDLTSTMKDGNGSGCRTWAVGSGSLRLAFP